MGFCFTVCLEQNPCPAVKRSLYYWGELFSTKILSRSELYSALGPDADLDLTISN